MPQLVHPGPEGVIFDAPNRDNPLPNDYYALNKKYTLHPARLIYGMVMRYIQRAGPEFCDAAMYKLRVFPALNIPVVCLEPQVLVTTILLIVHVYS